MSEKSEIKNGKDHAAFSRAVGAKAARKLKARRNSTQGVWFGLGMMGLIGWSVAVPTLLGAALGIWLDHRHPGSYSWTLMLLVIGLGLGCLNAWHWMTKEDKEMHDEQEDNNDE
jgi:ATP synthase protein I